jgi:DNA-binding MarR family transcriptional regulator
MSDANVVLPPPLDPVSTNSMKERSRSLLAGIRRAGSSEIPWPRNDLIHLAKLTYVSYVTYMSDDGDPIARAQALRVAIGRVARRMRQIYAIHEADEPTFNEIALLVHLARDGPATPTEIARGERITSQAIAPAIRELEARGLLDRSRHPRDGRSTVLTVTAAGRAALADRELAVVARLVQALKDDLTPADRERLESVVPVLNKLADSL